jgi:hypothetical protein
MVDLRTATLPEDPEMRRGGITIMHGGSQKRDHDHDALVCPVCRRFMNKRRFMRCKATGCCCSADALLTPWVATPALY